MIFQEFLIFALVDSNSSKAIHTHTSLGIQVKETKKQDTEYWIWS